MRCLRTNLFHALAFIAVTVFTCEPLRAQPIAPQLQCTPQWQATFGPAPGTDTNVNALTVFDDGAGGGPALYAGGTFTIAGGVAANRIAKWNGSSGRWSAVGNFTGSSG